MAACGDPPLAGASKPAAGAGQDLGGGLLKSADATEGGATSQPDASAEDTAGPVAEVAAGAEVAADAPLPVADAGQADATAETAGIADGAADANAPADAAAEPACKGCLFTAQPPAPHPGGKGPYALAPADEFDYAAGGLMGNYHHALVLRPDATGLFPTVFFVHGKQLFEGGGMPAKFGYPYRTFLEHIASHGYVVAFIRVEDGLLDADHLRMADDLLAATQAVFDKVSVANKSKVAFVGHSMGAKVVLLAAWKTLNSDQQNQWPDPQAVLMYAVSNEPPPMGQFQNALDKAKVMYKDAPTWFTFATGDDDDIAPWNDPKKPNAAALYDALPTEKKQLLVVQGTGTNDPNPPTKPELVDDHSAPLSIEGKPGGMADFAMPASHLDALDWYGYWKWTVGALNFHFKGGDAKWAYGDLRQHGGETADGKVIAHTVQKQGWTVLPAP